MKYTRQQLQDTYDRIISHLRRQGGRALASDGSTCEYLTAGGLQCAAGCCIPVTQYLKDMEGTDLFGTGISGDLVRDCLIRNGHDLSLVMCLQRVHDKKTVTAWESWFEVIAKVFGLHYAGPTDGAVSLLAKVDGTNDPSIYSVY